MQEPKKKSIREVLSAATVALQKAGVRQARMEAGSLLMHTLNVNRTFVVTHSQHKLTTGQFERFQRFVARRARREPLQYILGHADFLNLEFEVSPDVLIPRPETELIVEIALEIASREQSLTLLDVGTGSGCIVVSLLDELKRSRAVATDISWKALRIADANARRYHVRDRLLLIQANGLSTFHQPSFSLIVSNPPYVPTADVESLQPEVRTHEPLSALVSGADGLDHIRALLRDVPRLLQTNRHFIFEIGFGQCDAVEQLIDRAIWRLVEVRKDLQNIPRTVVLQKR